VPTLEQNRTLAANQNAALVQIDMERRQHCPYCKHLVFIGNLAPGSRIQLKCNNRHCNRLSVFCRM
jgi:hypothetical protein